MSERGPVSPFNATARPLAVVDGATKGPDGLPLSPFARFAQRIVAGGTLDDDLRGGTLIAPLPVEMTRPALALLADGRVLVTDPNAEPVIIAADGTVERLEPIWPVERGQ